MHQVKGFPPIIHEGLLHGDLAEGPLSQQESIFIVLPDFARMRDGGVIDEHEEMRPGGGAGLQ
jgi:hypothetical protein